MFSANTAQVSSDKLYVDDVFSTYLYTGNGSTQTINNGIDLAGKGGMVMLRGRATGTAGFTFDTAQGVNKYVLTNSANGQASNTSLTTFNSNGFSLSSAGAISVNDNGNTYASWTFRKAPKFFDVVTYTGDGTTNRTIAHNLAATPGCVIVKCTSANTTWFVYHRSLPVDGTFGPYDLRLNETSGQNNAGTFGTTLPTSSTFTVSGSNTNTNGATYVAYLFAHNAGGFGLTGTDNVISCGSYTGNGSNTGPIINLGYEPQWVLIKPASGGVNSGVGNWSTTDSMRGFTVMDQNDAWLRPNTSGAEFSFSGIGINSTGFQLNTTDPDTNAASATYIYIAIRRGPMKVPTDGTTVFGPVTRDGTGASTFVATPSGFTPDSVICLNRPGAFNAWYVEDRLRGLVALQTTGTGAEFSAGTGFSYGVMGGMNLGVLTAINSSDPVNGKYVDYYTKRAPGFFDEVCYTGTASGPITFSHNLGVAPELVIVKTRNYGSAPQANWYTGSVYSGTTALYLNLPDAISASMFVNNTWATDATSTTMKLSSNCNAGLNYVAYLFATCPGVSKVGSYTGTGTTQQINCGFTAGARFVLIKRTDSTGDWYVWDTARGIVAGNDPHLSLNTTAGEVTTDDSVDPDNSGFIVNQVAATNINVSSASYIYLAIA